MRHARNGSGHVQETNRGRFRLGDWMVDPDRLLIWSTSGNAEQGRRLEPRVMDLLLALADAEGKPLPRETLRNQLWNDAYIAAGAVKHLVWQLRKDLGDDARQSRFVETVPRRGYRLMLPTEPIADLASSKPQPVRLRRRGLALAAISLLAAGMLYALGWRQADRAEPRADLEVPLPRRPITALPGNEVEPAIAPDGQRLVFAWDGSGDGGDDGFDLWLQNMDGTGRRRLTDQTGSERYPAWSSDGNRVAYVRSEGTESTSIWVVSTEPRDRADSPQQIADELGVIADLAWTPDDRELIAAARLPDEGKIRLVSVPWNAGSRGARALTQPEDGADDLDPAVSPDGTRVAFRRSSRSGSDIYVVDRLDPSRIVRLTNDDAAILGLAWAADGNSLIFASNRSPPMAMWRAAWPTGELSWLGLADGSLLADPTISATTAEVVVQVMRCDSNFWRLVGDESRIEARLSSTRLDALPSFSADGASVAFLSDRGGSMQVWLASGDDTGPDNLGAPMLADQPATPHGLAWSPSGDHLVIAARSGTHSSIYRVRTTGGPFERLTELELEAVTPSVSGDGRQLYFAARVGGDWQLFRRSLLDPTAASVQLTRLGAWRPQEGPAGRHLYFSRPDEAGIWRFDLDVAGARPERVVAELSPRDTFHWQVVAAGGSLGDGHLVYLSRDRSAAQLMRFDLASGDTELLSELDRNLPYPPGLAVSPGVEDVLWVRLDEAASDLIAFQLEAPENSRSHGGQ